jgi:4,5:9,10-diseco-3-hydroxy-5,9,17-trioxoandrosta-1(10),2-diene-4-oate hydrolase
MEPYPTLPDRFVTAGGVRMRYWCAGEQGSPILLLHALACSADFWARVMAPLSKRHRVFALDLVGFGLSDKPDASYTAAYLAGTVRNFLDALGLERVHLVGNSMGGAVALQFARDYPARLDHLVLVCAAGLGHAVGAGPRLLSVPVLGEFLAKPRRRTSRRVIEACVHDRSVVPEVLVESVYHHGKSDGAVTSLLRTLRSFIRLGGQRADVIEENRAAFPRLAVPTLVLWGERDRMIPADYLDAVTHIPGVKVSSFASCGHYPQLEVPGEFCREVLGFLAPPGQR